MSYYEVIQEGWYYILTNGLNNNNSNNNNNNNHLNNDNTNKFQSYDYNNNNNNNPNNITNNSNNNNNNQKVLLECKYQILSDGILIYRLNYNNIIKINIKTLKYRLFDCSNYITTGYGLIIISEESDIYLIFDHIIDIKKFCFCCYRLTENKHELLNIISTMQWSKELEDLNIGLPEKKNSLKSPISYLHSLVKVSLDSNDQLPDTSNKKQSFNSNLLHSWASNDPKSTDDHQSSFITSPTLRKHSSKMSLDYDKIFRRLSSNNSELEIHEISPISSLYQNSNVVVTQSSDQTELKTPSPYHNLFSPVFVSSVLCLVDNIPENTNNTHNNNTMLNSPIYQQQNQFSKGSIQLFSSGTLIVNYEKKLKNEQQQQQIQHKHINLNEDNEDDLEIQKCSKSFTCRKVLCYKFQSSNEQKQLLNNNNNENNDENNEKLISDIALQLRIYPIASEIQQNRTGNSPMNSSRRPTPPVKLLSKKLKNGNIYAFGDMYSEIVLVFPSLAIAKTFLTVLSNIVPVHNILGFLIDMSWVNIDPENNKNNNNNNDDENTHTNYLENLTVDVCIPETIEEDEINEELVDFNQSSILNKNENKEDDTNIQQHEQQQQQHENNNKIGNRILQKLYSKDSYSGLENIDSSDLENNNNNNGNGNNISNNINKGIELQHQQSNSSNTSPQRKSRISRLFSLEFLKKDSIDANDSNLQLNRFTKVKNAFFTEVTSDSEKSIIEDDNKSLSEKFPGFKYRSNSNLYTNETNLSIIEEMDDIPPQQVAPGRYTTLKQLIGTTDGFTQNIVQDYSEIKGIKGTKAEFLPNSTTNSLASFSQTARARERVIDGFGAVIGGVLFDKLVIKRIEFTPRYLELKLHEILPIIVNPNTMNNATTNILVSPISPLTMNKLTPAKDLSTNIGSIAIEGHLILDGVDFSREKHVEIIIKILDLPIDKSIELLKSWVAKSIELSLSDIPDHWEDFINKNLSAFSQKVREAKELQLLEQKNLQSNSHSQSNNNNNSLDNSSHHFIESFSVTIPPLWDGSNDNLQKLNDDANRVKINECNGYIQSLDLRYCQITNRGVSILVDSLRKNTTLLSLNLAGNSLDRDSTAASLGNMLNFNTTLVEVNLQETSLGNTGATLVAQALHINMTIEKISLSGNKIGPVGCAMLCMALEENTTLTHLNLSRNLIGIEGTKWISKALYTNKTLTYLDLNRQQLKGKFGTDGAKYLSRSLRMNNTLIILRIGRNRIGFEGARFLAGMLLINRGLRILDISHSKVGVEGAIQLANSLNQNNTLQNLILANRLLPVCYLKGVHDSDYYKYESKQRFTLPNEINEQFTDSPPTSARSNISDTHSLYHLEDDIYRADDALELNCDIAYECQEKNFERIDLQILFASNIPNQISNNIEDWTTETFSKSFGNNNNSSNNNNNNNNTTKKSNKNNDKNNIKDKNEINLSEINNMSPSDLELGQDRNSTTRIIRPLAITDEESVLIAHLLRSNHFLQELRLEHTFLPIQLLRGRSLISSNSKNKTSNSLLQSSTIASPILGSTHMYSMDLTNSNLVSSDATVIGVLIAENPYLRTVCLKGNYFQKTDGETWIANAINKNPHLCLDTNLWSAEEMFADGYHQLAALKGVSVSGAAIEPQRLDTLWDKALVLFSGIGYYLDITSDIYVTYLYSLNSELIEFVPWSALIISIPTFMTLGSIFWTTFFKHPCRAILQMIIVIFQLHPLWHVYESIVMEIETTALLDSKFLEGIYEAIPQILLQTYIMFLLSVSSGKFQLPIFISLLLSMLTVSGVLVMLVDRGKVRQITLGPRRKNPWFVRYLAHGLAVLFEGEHICQAGKYNIRSHEGMKELIHYSSYTYSHYTWAMILHFSTLAVRLIAITWLLVVVHSYKFVIFLTVFFLRGSLLFFLDPRTKRRSTFRSLVWCLCYCLITGIWDKDERSPVASRRAFLYLNILDTVESTIFICYAAFLSKNSQMKLIHGLLTFAAVIICRAISWLLIIKWHLPIHYSELQTEDKLKTSWFDLARFRLFSSDTRTFIDDVVSRVDTPVIPIPDGYSTNINQSLNTDKKYSTKGGRPKSWWSSEERSATMELSYLTAVVDSKLVLFSNPQGVTIQQSTPSPSPISTPRDSDDSSDQNDEKKGQYFRDRRVARDWDAMPEVVKQSQGRFQLKGGKNIYTDADLSKSLEQRHQALSCKTRRGFSGWNKHVVPFSKPQHTQDEELKTSSNEIENENISAINLADFKSKSLSSGHMDKTGNNENNNINDNDNNNNENNNDCMEVENKNEKNKLNNRRGTAQLDYNDFIPAIRPHSTEKLPLSPTYQHNQQSSQKKLSPPTSPSLQPIISNNNNDDHNGNNNNNNIIQISAPPTTITSQNDSNNELNILKPKFHEHVEYKHDQFHQNNNNNSKDEEEDMIWEVNPSHHNFNNL